MHRPIRDYAIIGNLRSAALVSKEASIDWAPAPYLNSPSVFAALLDELKGGSWSIVPTQDYTVEQEYEGFTNIVVTRFTTKQGIMEVIDWIPAQGNGEPQDAEKAEVHRKVVCAQGECEARVVFAPRFDYARGVTSMRQIQEGLEVWHEGEKKGELVAPGVFDIADNTATATLPVVAGEPLYLTFHYHDVQKEEWSKEHHERELVATRSFWNDWVHRCDIASCLVAGPWHDMVVRSSLVLKILFFEPPGSMAAAATTSLPESIGGVRNWDYRFSWIRDSSFALRALAQMGYIKEARRYVEWLFAECCGMKDFRPEDVLIMYGLQGETNLQEEILPHLAGYKGSKPVRIGNAAHSQKQWDVFGSLLDTIWQIYAIDPQYEITLEAWNILRMFANYVVKIWQEPDEGLWEVRGGKEQFVYSKVMCWVALDRAVKLATRYSFEGELELWRKEQEAIKKEVMERGWSEKKESFVQTFDSEDLDAALLLMPVFGFIEGTHPRMISTIEAIERELSVQNGLLLRYTAKDGLPGREGAFLPASFWLVDALVFAKEQERARRFLAHLVKLANHVGLYAEEINPKTLEFLGNFPQAYTHIGLINSAYYLANGKGKGV